MQIFLAVQNINHNLFSPSYYFQDERTGVEVELTGLGRSKKLAKNAVSVNVLKHLGIIPQDFEWELESKPVSLPVAVLHDMAALPEQSLPPPVPVIPVPVELYVRKIQVSGCVN